MCRTTYLSLIFTRTSPLIIRRSFLCVSCEISRAACAAWAWACPTCCKKFHVKSLGPDLAGYECYAFFFLVCFLLVLTTVLQGLLNWAVISRSAWLEWVANFRVDGVGGDCFTDFSSAITDKYFSCVSPQIWIPRETITLPIVTTRLQHCRHNRRSCVVPNNYIIIIISASHACEDKLECRAQSQPTNLFCVKYEEDEQTTTPMTWTTAAQTDFPRPADLDCVNKARFAAQ